MKFAPGRMYVESYNKCPNCGILLYEKPVNAVPDPVVVEGKTYCSAWCVEWEEERKKRRQSSAAA